MQYSLFFRSLRQIKLANGQLLGARNYSLSYRIVVYRLLTVGPMLTSQSATDNYCSAITDGRFDEPHVRDVLLFCLRNVRYLCLR